MRVIMLALACLLVGCATFPCPPVDTVIFVGPGIPVMIEQGFFDDPANYLTKEEFERKLEEHKKAELKKRQRGA